MRDALVNPKHVDDYGRGVRRYGRQVFASQNLQEQIDRMAQAHNAIIIRHLDDRILAWNQGAAALYGWSEGEVQGKKIHTLLRTEFQEVRESIELVLCKEGQWEGQFTQTHRTGRCMIVASRQVLVHMGPHQAAVIVEMNRDETERAFLVREHIEAAVREAALQETAQQMSAFVGMVSHELRTPLTSIKGHLQLAQLHLTRLQLRVIGEEGMKQALTTIQYSLDRADRQINVQNRLVNDLIDLSRIQTDQLNVQQTQCDLVQIVQEALEDQRILMPSRLIRWTSLIIQAPVLADEDRIGQVINNYISNALKYSPVDAPVDVRLEQEKAMIRVSVRDEGSGISETEQQLIWKRFYRVEEHENKNGSGVSLGLGLYISRALIEQQGGHVGVESVPTCGSTFWFTLPSISSE
ncbi:PAS domain-containing sensor histidine kinase [Ktedonobacteria bacterium brp13]|nr:PAS domain-containing sensor histidine kinase [Ktedonobacteria bacterium brp13]